MYEPACWTSYSHEKARVALPRLAVAPSSIDPTPERNLGFITENAAAPAATVPIPPRNRLRLNASSSLGSVISFLLSLLGVLQVFRHRRLLSPYGEVNLQAPHQLAVGAHNRLLFPDEMSVERPRSCLRP